MGCHRLVIHICNIDHLQITDMRRMQCHKVVLRIQRDAENLKLIDQQRDRKLDIMIDLKVKIVIFDVIIGKSIEVNTKKDTEDEEDDQIKMVCKLIMFFMQQLR